MMIWYERHPDLRVTSLEGEGVALHLGSRRYFTVNETGVVILEALAVARTFEMLVAAVTARYDVDDAHAARSVQGFLDRCLAADLVRAEERAG
jgi:hypothetical protein